MKQAWSMPEVLALLGGDADPKTAPEWVRHHLEQCRRCREALLEEVGLTRLEELTSLLGDRQALKERWELHQAEEGLAEHRVATPGEVEAAFEADPRLRTPGMVSTLLERCRRSWGMDAREALGWAQVAVELAERIHGAMDTHAYAADAAARAWAYAGNCWRIQGVYQQAEEAFANAHDLLERGSGELGIRAEVLDLEVSLRRGQRRFAEAERLSVEVVDLYQQAGLGDAAAKALAKHAVNLRISGQPEQATAWIDQALARLAPAQSGRWYAMALATKGQLEFELGHHEVARRLLPEVRDLLQQHGGELDRLRWRWFEARVAGEMGNDETAERELRAVYQAFGEREMAYDVALVGLDLAILLARQGRTAEIQELAAEMTPVFVARGIDREATGSLLLFRYAAEREAISLHYLMELRRFLEEASYKPGLVGKAADVG